MKPIANLPTVSNEELNFQLEFSNKFHGSNFDRNRYRTISSLNYPETLRIDKNKGTSANPYESNVMKYATQYGVDPSLVNKVMKQENSRYNPFAVSGANAKGLMQLTDDTFMFIKGKLEKEGVSITSAFNPDDNIHAGVYYLNYLSKKFGNTDLSLAAYNAGPGNVNKWISKYKSNDWAIINKSLESEKMFGETRNYVKTIMGYE